MEFVKIGIIGAGNGEGGFPGNFMVLLEDDDHFSKVSKYPNGKNRNNSPK